MTEYFENVVIGGGLAGLGVAREINDCMIIEGRDYLGGHASSFEFKNFHFDYGAHICHSKDEMWLELLELESCSLHQASDVRNIDKGSWIGYPVQNNLRDLPEAVRDSAFSEIKNNVSAGNIKLENYLDWCNSVYGKTLTENYYRRYTDKYWRTPMESMDTSWLSGRVMPIDLNKVEQGVTGEVESQAVFNSYRYPSFGGFNSLFSAIYETSAEVKLGDSVAEIIPREKKIVLESGAAFTYKRLFNTSSLKDIFSMMPNIPEDISEKASSLRYLNLYLTCVVIENCSAYFPDWFYIYDSDIDVSRVFNVSKVSNRDSNIQALQFETFRRDDEVVDRKEVYDSIRRSIERVLNRRLHDDEFKTEFVKYSYVVPTAGTDDNRLALIAYLRDQGIQSAGLYGTWKYMWSDQSFFSGSDCVRETLRREKDVT